MVKFTYTNVPGKLSELLKKIRTVGVPPKATVQWLKSLGFTSSNDPSILTVLKLIGFCDESGVPADCWRHYRGNNHAVTLANAVRAGYMELFQLYPDAFQRSDEDLTSFFSTHSNAGRQVIDSTVRTFKTLCASANFSAVAPADQSLNAPTATHTQPETAHRSVNKKSGPSVHIDIQVHISSDAKPDQIDQIFKSMATHLYKDAND